MSGREISYQSAIREALSEEMKKNERIFLMGEDLSKWGSPWGVVKGLADEFGTERVRDTPISEDAFIGAAVGAAVAGYRPVVELMFSDFLGVCFDRIGNQAAKLRYMSGGTESVPLVLRVPYGLAGSAGSQHSQVLYSIVAHMPGLKCVAPSTPADAKGLMKSALNQDDPVVYFEHKQLFQTKGLVPSGEFRTPIGKADVKREGADVSIVATGLMVKRALEAADELANRGVSAEVVDTRSIVPLDRSTIVKSAEKTGRVLVVDEDYLNCGLASEISAVIADEAFEHLDAPVKRLTTPDVSIPYSPPLEAAVIPSSARILEEVAALLRMDS